MGASWLSRNSRNSDGVVSVKIPGLVGQVSLET